MAEGSATGPASGEQFGFLVRKAGPLPVWMWGAIIVGIYYWYTKYGPGASAATPAVTTTDAGDTTGPMYGASQYSSNAQWEGAAINYLVGESVPPDQASTALFNYLHSKPLTTDQQKDVNLAIEGIGPPPDIPGPAPTPKPPKPPHHRQRDPDPNPHPHEPPPRHRNKTPRGRQEQRQDVRQRREQRQDNRQHHHRS